MDFFKTQIIEFFGLPRTGKTTTAKSLSVYLNSIGKKTYVAKERASTNPIKDKLHPKFNYWTGVSFIKEYIEANEKGVDIIIADRGLFDASVWIDMLSKNIGDLKYSSEFNKIFLQPFVLDNYLTTFYFYADLDVIMNREGIRQMEKNSHRIMNYKSLGAYLSAYENTKDRLSNISHVNEFDTTNFDITETLSYVKDAINIQISKQKPAGVELAV